MWRVGDWRSAMAASGLPCLLSCWWHLSAPAAWLSRPRALQPRAALVLRGHPAVAATAAATVAVASARCSLPLLPVASSSQLHAATYFLLSSYILSLASSASS